MVSVFISQCRIIINLVLLFEFLRISGESRIVSDLSLQHRNVIRQPVATDNNQIIQRHRFNKNTTTTTTSDSINTNENVNEITCQCLIKDEVICDINNSDPHNDDDDDDDQIKTNNLPKCLRCTNASMFY